jgi:predicted ATPase/DNA-binding CsgD family transcriptional regulator
MRILGSGASRYVCHMAEMRGFARVISGWRLSEKGVGGCFSIKLAVLCQMADVSPTGVCDDSRMRSNLPPQFTSFVGRQREVAELEEAVGGCRFVTLTGAGGCGKTRLALQVAGELVERYADGVWLVELAPVADPERVAAMVARVLGFREEEGRPVLATLCEHVGDLETLIVLDNCEHVVGACAHLAEALLEASPGTHLLATSREPLSGSGEATWRVPSLDSDASVRLFIDRAEQARPGFAPTPDETAVIADVCRRLDGIPLAIELAAARARIMHPSRIAAALDDRFRLLTGGGRTAVPRQQTLEASVSWSYDLLDDEERTLLRRLSVFFGGFTLDAAEQVCSADPLDAYRVLDLLSRLVDKSLVQVRRSDAEEDRYGLLETIRVYAQQRLVEAGEAEATRHHHAAFFVALAEQAEPELAGARGPAWLARLEREHNDLRAALEWLDATGSQESFIRLAGALTLFWELRGHLKEGGRWFARALAADGPASPIRARALWGATHVAMYGDDFATAARLGPQALAMAEDVGDASTTARALNVAAYMRLYSEPGPARADLERSIALGLEAGDDWAVADGHKMMTVTWLMQENHEELEPAAEALRAVAQRLHNKFFLAWHQCVLGWIAVRRGELGAARQALAASLELCHEVGEPVTAGVVVAELGEADLLAGEHDKAWDRLNAFLPKASATGGATGVPMALIRLASIALAREEPAVARGMLEPLVPQMEALGAPLFASWAGSLLGAALVATGEWEAGERTLAAAEHAGLGLENRWLVALTRYHLAEAARLRGRLRQAEDLHHDALAARVRGGFLPGVVESLEALASLAAMLESFAEAARLLGATQALREARGLGPASALARDALTVSRRALGPDAFEVARGDGRALSLDDALAYAARARGERKRPSTGWESLTPTERAVVKLVAEGLTNPQIGGRLFIGRGTVKTHLAHAFAKVGVNSRSQLAGEAIRRGL